MDWDNIVIRVRAHLTRVIDNNIHDHQRPAALHVYAELIPLMKIMPVRTRLEVNDLFCTLLGLSASQKRTFRENAKKLHNGTLIPAARRHRKKRGQLELFTN